MKTKEPKAVSERGAKIDVLRNSGRLGASPVTSHAITTPEFAMKLRKLRLQHFNKQIALAVACDCSAAHISWLETGKRYPSPRMLQRIKRALTAAQVTQEEISEMFTQARADMDERYSTNFL